MAAIIEAKAGQEIIKKNGYAEKRRRRFPYAAKVFVRDTQRGRFSLEDRLEFRNLHPLRGVRRHLHLRLPATPASTARPDRLSGESSPPGGSDRSDDGGPAGERPRALLPRLRDVREGLPDRFDPSGAERPQPLPGGGAQGRLADQARRTRAPDPDARAGLHQSRPHQPDDRSLPGRGPAHLRHAHRARPRPAGRGTAAQGGKRPTGHPPAGRPRCAGSIRS